MHKIFAPIYFLLFAFLLSKLSFTQLTQFSVFQPLISGKQDTYLHLQSHWQILSSKKLLKEKNSYLKSTIFFK